MFRQRSAGVFQVMLLGIILCPAPAAAQTSSETKLSVQLDNFVWYYEDGDPHNYGTTTQNLSPLPAGTAKAMMRNVIIADVVSIGGKPARGAYVSHGVALRVGSSDLPRNQLHEFVLDIQTPDMGQIGGLFGTFLSSGSAAPGAPRGGGT